MMIDCFKVGSKASLCIDDAVTHMMLPGHFPRPGPDLGGARGIAPGVAGGQRGVERETIAGVSDGLRAQAIMSWNRAGRFVTGVKCKWLRAEIEPDHNLYYTD